MSPMGWNELERLVEEAERDPALRRSLRAPRSWTELALACQRLGYQVTGADLRHAQALDPSPTHGREYPEGTPVRAPQDSSRGSALRETNRFRLTPAS